MGGGLCQGNGLDRCASHLHTSGRDLPECPMPKAQASEKASKPAAADMSTAEATVATLLAHGLNTVYALPGVHNDHLFDAFQRAGDALRVVHTRHEQGAAYMALGAALATGKPQAYCGGARPRPAQFRRGAAHRLWHERAGAGADRANSARRDRQGPRPSARNPRPGRHHRAAGRSFRAHPWTGGSVGQSRQGDRVDAPRPARTRRARMRHRRVGQARPECARPAVAGAQRRASTRTKCARPRSSWAKPSAC